MAHGWTLEDVERLQKGRQTPQAPPRATIAPPMGKPSKYGAEAVEIDGKRFASKKEGRRYQDLKLLEFAGAIRDLECQPKYELWASNGEVIGRFTPDFRYYSLELGRLVVEDVKGGRATRTEAYQLRKRLFTACHGIILTEV